MRRVVVLGNSGSGKTTLAAALAARLGAPHVELDALHWEPGWQEADDDVFRARLATATAGDTWVVDGGYLRTTQQVLWPRADTAIWLDLPLSTLLRSVIRRNARRARTQEVLWGTNTETFRLLWFDRDSLLRYLVTTYRPQRTRLLSAMTDPRFSHLTWHHLRSRKEVHQLLDATRAP